MTPIKKEVSSPRIAEVCSDLDGVGNEEDTLPSVIDSIPETQQTQLSPSIKTPRPIRLFATPHTHTPTMCNSSTRLSGTKSLFQPHASQNPGNQLVLTSDKEVYTQNSKKFKVYVEIKCNERDEILCILCSIIEPGETIEWLCKESIRRYQEIHGIEVRL